MATETSVSARWPGQTGSAKPCAICALDGSDRSCRTCKSHVHLRCMQRIPSCARCADEAPCPGCGTQFQPAPKRRARGADRDLFSLLDDDLLVELFLTGGATARTLALTRGCSRRMRDVLPWAVRHVATLRERRPGRTALLTAPAPAPLRLEVEAEWPVRPNRRELPAVAIELLDCAAGAAVEVVARTTVRLVQLDTANTISGAQQRPPPLRAHAVLPLSSPLLSQASAGGPRYCCRMVLQEGAPSPARQPEPAKPPWPAPETFRVLVLERSRDVLMDLHCSQWVAEVLGEVATP
jgi:hypothetical protein